MAASQTSSSSKQTPASVPAPWDRGRLASGLLPLLLLVLLGMMPTVKAAQALPLGPPQTFLCDGDPLIATVDGGPVDAVGIANTSKGTVPGAFVVLEWRQLRLTLPRTNNAGPPSYTDGQWWWSMEDPARPTFRLRAGESHGFDCRPQDQANP
jgi:hypothetical protein